MRFELIDEPRKVVRLFEQGEEQTKKREFTK